MATLAPGTYVEGPTRVALPFGLFSAADMRSGADNRWLNGIDWQSITCNPAGGIGDRACAPDPTIGLPKDFIEGYPNAEASPFLIYGSHVCAPVGTSVNESIERANAHLLAREEARVEQALWTGDLGNTPNLRGATDLTPAAVAVDPVSAIGLLENWIATEYGSLGVIHMTRAAATASFAAGALYEKDGRLLTNLGTPVVAGAGYDGSSPAGVAAPAGESWTYATPAIFGFRSEIMNSTGREGDNLSYTTNDLYSIAERGYILGYDNCGEAAILQALGCAC